MSSLRSEKNTPMRTVWVRNLGCIDYHRAFRIQTECFEQLHTDKLARRQQSGSDGTPDTHYLLLCEHPSVFTLGKSGKAEHLLHEVDRLAEMGIDFVRTTRGGDITYHGPGQLVAYPILDLEAFYTDIHRYMRELEAVVIQTLADFGVPAGRYPGYTGVWLEPSSPSRARKICAQGVKCSRWITMHGLALNVDTDLRPFEYIVPCGIRDRAVTSMAQELGECTPSLEQVQDRLIKHFADVFDARLRALPEAAVSTPASLAKPGNGTPRSPLNPRP